MQNILHNLILYLQKWFSKLKYDTTAVLTDSLKRKMMNCMPPCFISSRTSLPAASVIHPIGEGHHQKTCRGDTQKRSSQDTEKEMEDNVIQTQHMEIDNEESESPFHQREQSLWRRAIRILFILFIILGIIVIFMIASQYDYLEWERIIRSLGLNKCMNGFVKLRFAGMYNPPVWTIMPSALNKAFQNVLGFSVLFLCICMC